VRAAPFAPLMIQVSQLLEFARLRRVVAIDF
jgi:hypothetical protein